MRREVILFAGIISVAAAAAASPCLGDALLQRRAASHGVSVVNLPARDGVERSLVLEFTGSSKPVGLRLANPLAYVGGDVEVLSVAGRRIYCRDGGAARYATLGVPGLGEVGIDSVWTLLSRGEALLGWVARLPEAEVERGCWSELPPPPLPGWIARKWARGEIDEAEVKRLYDLAVRSSTRTATASPGR